jgi:hypothetical protein
VKLKDGQAAQFQRAAFAAGYKTTAAWLRDLGAQAVAMPSGDLQRQAATPTAHAGGTQNSTGGLDSVLRNGLKLEALKAKLGVKTLAQVEAGEAAKPLPIRGNTFTSVQGAVIDVGNAPVEDVPTVSWRERLAKAQQKLEVEGDYEGMGMRRKPRGQGSVLHFQPGKTPDRLARRGVNSCLSLLCFTFYTRNQLWGMSHGCC